jgi:hypothetical protein
MKIVKGGWTFDRIRYQPAVERLARRLIDERRPFLVLPAEAERGPRFNSDDAIYARIESNYEEEEFMGCPGTAVDAMLIDAGQSDYWYHFDKDYDSPCHDCIHEESEYGE